MTSQASIQKPGAEPQSISNRIERMFQKLREENRASLIFFLTAGHPSSDATLEAVAALEAGGTDLIELGIPFSDPVADGPTIQHSSQVALEQGMTVAGVLQLVKRIREQSEIPLVLFSGYNPIFHYGETRFVEDAAAAGADGVLIPDLPPEEGGTVEAACQSKGLSTVYLAAPTTTDERFSVVAGHSTGFLYYISLQGVTGARSELPSDLKRRLSNLRSQTDLPVAVGFGISEPRHAAEVARVADGVVVGSALVRLIDENAGTENFSETIRSYAASLAEAVAGARST